MVAGRGAGTHGRSERARVCKRQAGPREMSSQLRAYAAPTMRAIAARNKSEVSATSGVRDCSSTNGKSSGSTTGGKGALQA
jgi:hypothetical protein